MGKMSSWTSEPTWLSGLFTYEPSLRDSYHVIGFLFDCESAGSRHVGYIYREAFRLSVISDAQARVIDYGAAA